MANPGPGPFPRIDAGPIPDHGIQSSRVGDVVTFRSDGRDADEGQIESSFVVAQWIMASPSQSRRPSGNPCDELSY